MILKAKHHFFIDPFFQWYAIRKMSRHFHSVRYFGDFTDRKLPVLLLCNHNAWWDGFWAMALNKRVFKRKFYFMMLEDQLRKYRFFNYTGGFSVKKNSRSIIESLNYSTELLKNPGHIVLIFPQGRIQSMHHGEFVFERGVERILKNTLHPVHVIFEVNLIDYFSNPKPSLFIYFQEYEKDSLTAESLGEAYTNFYRDCISRQKQIEH